MQQTDDVVYCLENVSLFETLYGKNLISLGGEAAIENMFSDINFTSQHDHSWQEVSNVVLNDMKALDIGFGLGGVAFYLAKKYRIKISGIEIHPWMVGYANKHAPKTVAHLLNFNVYGNEGKIPFETAAFNLVYSKGVLNHVRDKFPLFKDINRVLRPGGLLVIADWIYPEANKNNLGPLVNETRDSYQKVLEQTGFVEISFRDDSLIFKAYIQNFLQNLLVQKEFLEQNFGEQLFSEIRSDHQKLINDLDLREKFAVRIKARKGR